MGDGLELEMLSGMSKNNNVNPGQYKVAGRLHPGDDKTEQEEAKAKASIAEQELHEQAHRGQKDKKDGSRLRASDH
jgi:hypothetical protein